jgi:hypothetical protein
LAARVAALEEAVAALKSGPAPETGGTLETALLSQALADLKAKLANGAPYEAEAQTIARLVPGAPGLDRLSPYSATGLPTVQGLAGEIETASRALPVAEGGDVQTADSGGWAVVGDLLGSIVTIRTIGEVDWRDIAVKAAQDARSGNLPAAIARLDDSEAPLPPPLGEWRDKAKARIGADQALEEVSTAVLRVLSAAKS